MATVQEALEQLVAAIKAEIDPTGIADMVRAHVERSGKDRRKANGKKRGNGKGKGPCYYPGCRNAAAPRYQMFCAALHKDLSKAEKKKYKKLHDAKAASAT